MKRIIFDAEADNLYHEATQMWCLCTKDIDTGDGDYYDVTNGDLEWGIRTLFEADEIIGHNIIGYDLALISKLYPHIPKYKGRVFDTMIVSQLLNPERFGGHSLERFGELLRFPKQEHNDWSCYTQEMLQRCITDVELNEKVYHMLQREAGEDIIGEVLWA